MTERNRDYLKQEFKDGERPSGTDFADLIDSFINKTNDGMSVDTDGNLSLSRGVRLGDSAGTTAGTLRFHGGVVQFHDGTTWMNVASGDSGAFQPIGGSTAVAYGAGNVGIGTFSTPPTYRLEVELGANTAESERVRFGNAVCSNGSATYQGYACYSHRNHSSNTDYALRQGPNGNVHINAPTNQPISIRQNGNQIRMGISSTGNVVVGAEADLSGAGAALLQVAGNTYINGNITITGEAYKHTAGAWLASDVRVKENIRSYEFGLQHLVQIRPVRFRYNGKAGTPAGYEGIGVVGQEIEKIIPGMVQHVKSPNPGELDSDDMLLYNDSALTYVLVNAVKELASKVYKLETELAEFRAGACTKLPDTP